MERSIDDPFDDGWARPRPGVAGLRRDAVLAVVLTLLAGCSALLYTAGGLYPEPAAPWLTALVLAAQMLPLAVRRRWPAVVLLVCSVAFIVGQVVRIPEVLVSNIALFIALYTLGAWGRDRRVATAVRAFVVLAMFTWLFISFLTTSAGAAGFEQEGPMAVPPFVAYQLISIITNLLYFGGAWAFGERSWIAARGGAALARRSDELVVERERTAAQAVVGERLRIARDLHDVVAHHVAVMGVQAAAARRLQQRDPERAAASLAAVESSARQAVDDLHRMLGTLRDGDGDPLPTGTDDDGPSTHRLDRIPALVADAARTGLAATFTEVGDPREIPGTVAAALFRIAQEAVTNTMKHAAPTAVLDVRLRWTTGAVELEAADSGGAARSAPPGSGLGLIGMRERLAAVGGTLEAGPRSAGGWLVRARVALDDGGAA